MNKKGEFLARDFLIILVLFGTTSLLGYLIVLDVSSADNGYGINNVTDDKFVDNYDTFTDSSGKIYQMQNATSNTEGLSSLSSTVFVFKSVISVISLIFGSIAMVNHTFASFVTDFGVPSVIANLIFPALLVILIVTLVFVIISSVSQGKM